MCAYRLTILQCERIMSDRKFSVILVFAAYKCKICLGPCVVLLLLLYAPAARSTIPGSNITTGIFTGNPHNPLSWVSEVSLVSSPNLSVEAKIINIIFRILYDLHF